MKVTSKRTSTPSTSASSKKPKKKNLSWLASSSAQQQELMDRQQAMSSLGKRAPETWVTDGGFKILRFRDPEPVGMLNRYSVRLNGKFISVTAPAAGQVDLLASEGFRPQCVAIYEVIDRDGYTAKDGKVNKNIPRFFVASLTLHKLLQSFAEETGPLDSYDVKLKRTGTGISTSYTIFKVANSRANKAGLSEPRLADDLEDYYAPPSLEQQEAIVMSASPSN